MFCQRVSHACTQTTKRQMISLVVAATSTSLAIGRNGSLPWRLPTDTKFFKLLTTPHTVIMGHTTWRSIPSRFRPFPNRTNIVLSRTPESILAPDSVLRTTSLDAALAAAKGHVFIVGGAEIYAVALAHPALDAIFLTQVYADEGVLKCDTFMQDFRSKPWVRRSTDQLKSCLDSIGAIEAAKLVPHGIVTENGIEYEFTLWKRE
ncbi:dihydrofolate reductase-like domain-containing protein [Lipomyces arxii]|uniref:dihydrofolate reductase-like domain-containing protein n=1 Tax=Lipomyces arxii TaxID=56418 RepID=UPI0034CE3B75